MAVLVTGASGYIGSKLVREITSAGETVHALCRHPTAELKNNTNVKIYSGNITNIQLLTQAISGCKLVYHLAAEFNTPSLEKMRQTNVVASKSLFLLAMQHNAKVVFTSSAGVIGPQINQNFVTEATRRTAPYFNNYEQTKAEAEQEALTLHKQGLQIVIVNPTRVFGPGKLNQGNFLTLIIEKYQKGIWRFIPGDGNALSNVVYIDDVVLGHQLAMRYGKSGERYILGGENISTNKFFALLATITKKNYTMFHISVDMIKGLVKIADYVAILLDKEPVVTPEWVERYTYNWGADISKAKSQLNYHPLSLIKGLNKTIYWLR